MTRFGSDRNRDEVVLVARILLVILYFVFGWAKLTDYSGTVGAMSHSGLPLPQIAALVATAVELLGAAALALGVWARPIAVPAGNLHSGNCTHRTSLLGDDWCGTVRERDQFL